MSAALGLFIAFEEANAVADRVYRDYQFLDASEAAVQRAQREARAKRDRFLAALAELEVRADRAYLGADST